MPFTREQAYRTLASLKPAPVFLQSYEAKPLPDNLEIYFGPPEEFFIAPDTQEVYTQGRRVPILDDGNFGLVLFFDPVARTLVEFDVESPQKETATFRHWQQYLAHLMIRIADSTDDDEEIRRIVGIIQFAHTRELFEYFDRSRQLEGDAWWEARRRFPLSINAERGASLDLGGT
jgi:hypothetical protein